MLLCSLFVADLIVGTLQTQRQTQFLKNKIATISVRMVFQLDKRVFSDLILYYQK